MVRPRLPVGRDGPGSRLRRQGLQPLLRGRIAQVIEPVELERLHQTRDVLLCGDLPRLVRPANDVRHHQSGQYADDDDDDHDLQQGEPALGGFGFHIWNRLSAARA